jgi:ribosomal protein S12 methylthiotransferase accessory factor
MLNRPRFRPHFHIEVVPGEGVVLLSDTRHFLLRGRLYEVMAPLLDGRPANDLCEQLRGQASPADVFYALTLLERKNYLCEHESTLPVGQAALWSSQQIAPSDAARRLAARPVGVAAFGVDPAPFCDLLESLQVRWATNGPLDVVLTDSAHRPELKEINAQALRDGRPWLLVKPVGRQIWIGPLFSPEEKSGCWACLAERLRSNFPLASYLQDQNGHAASVNQDRAATPATLQVAHGLAANSVAAWVVRGKLPELEGKLQTLDLPTWRWQTHTLVKLPFCAECGSGKQRSFESPLLASCKKTNANDGGFRVVSPEATLARNLHHVSSITGAVTMLERAAPSTDGVIHVYVAGNNSARPSTSLGEFRSDLRTMNSGKGTSDVQSRAGALCEALERYSGVFRGDEPRQRARMTELGGAALPLNDCLLFSDRQFRERTARNEHGSRFSFIPVQFDPDAEVEWSPVWSLTRGEIRYLPTSFCYYDYPQPCERTYCIACSNGCAAGNTLAEAILQGFLELVERDGVALWWYNRVCRPGVNLDSFGDAYIDRLRDFLREHGREFWAIDLTTDFGIPVFASITRRTDGLSEQIMPGFGAHLDPKVALLRAVTEMSQMLTSPLLAKPDKGHDKEAIDPDTAHWLETATTANQPYLLPADGPPQTVTSYSQTWSDDVADDVRACQKLIERAGLEMLVLDQTRPEIGLPVVKVIVPGLRHFWARLAPGRLYDVPVRLGWLPKRLAESELNPLPMFL